MRSCHHRQNEHGLTLARLVLEQCTVIPVRTGNQMEQFVYPLTLHRHTPISTVTSLHRIIKMCMCMCESGEGDTQDFKSGEQQTRKHISDAKTPLVATYSHINHSHFGPSRQPNTSNITRPLATVYQLKFSYFSIPHDELTNSTHLPIVTSPAQQSILNQSICGQL